MIDQHLFLLDILLLSVFATIVAVFLSQVLKKEDAIETAGTYKGNISTEGFDKPEAIAVSCVVLLFSLSVWLPLIVDLESLQEKSTSAPASQMAFVLDMLLTIIIQFGIPTAILLFLLGLKCNILDSLGLRNCNWGKVSFYSIAGLVFIYISLVLLHAVGLEAWLTTHFGEIGDQAAVQILLIFSVISSGLIFSVVHGSVKALIPLFIIGMILAIIYELSGSVWTNILLHAMFNLINVLLMLNIT